MNYLAEHRELFLNDCFSDTVFVTLLRTAVETEISVNMHRPVRAFDKNKKNFLPLSLQLRRSLLLEAGIKLLRVT